MLLQVDRALIDNEEVKAQEGNQFMQLHRELCLPFPEEAFACQVRSNAYGHHTSDRLNMQVTFMAAGSRAVLLGHLKAAWGPGAGKMPRYQKFLPTGLQ